MHYVSGMASAKPAFASEIRLFRKHGGAMRMSDVVKAGVSRRTLYAMRDEGVIHPLSRGLYRLAGLEALGNPDLVTVAARIPHGVLCLISALAFHELTTQVPHVVDIALERGTRKPRLDYPPTRFFWFSATAFRGGIEVRRVDSVNVRVYDPEKTIVDCFRYRNQIGMDVVLEALGLWRERRPKKLDTLLTYARARRVERNIRPFVQALL